MAQKLHYHFIGIGGVGMSAIAQILHERGERISGSDRNENDVTRRLRGLGIPVCIGHSETNVNGADVVVYTAAIKRDNPEMLEARSKGIPMLERPAMLGMIMEPYKHRVAVSGTHGKTTTSSMISVIMDEAKLDASVLVGGDVKSLGTNARLGDGSIVITEACEAFESFLHLWPSIAVITNIDADHLDYYGTIERIEESFRQFVSQVDRGGCVVANCDDERVRRTLAGCGRKIVWFGFDAKADYAAVDINLSTPRAEYTLLKSGEEIGRVKIGVPGEQNVVNSLAAVAVAYELGVSFESIRGGLYKFDGAGRRFEILYNDGEIMVVDDYAHHPAEVKVTLAGAKSAYNKHTIAVFQPHMYSRAKIFCDDFAEALAIADEVIVAPIYAARELPVDGVSGEMIAEKMRESGYDNVVYAPDKNEIADELCKRIKLGDMVVFLGAGDIRAVGEELAARLKGDCCAL